jgi:SAM-dependent methyltransferase
MDRSDPAYAGQELYTERFLRIYDPVVLGFNCNVVWRCPTSRMVEQYSRHLGKRHLDVGPGTGYFLQHARVPGDFSLTLLDPNPDVLAHASRRLAGLRPRTVQADVLKPLPLSGEDRFDSAALNYVIHCLPGPMTRKAQAIEHIAAVLEPNGVLFGATVLGSAAPHTWLSRPMLWYCNRSRIFDNAADTFESLRDALSTSFSQVELTPIGTAAIFAASNKR